MATDSDGESDAELRPHDMRKHTDRETTSSNRRKYDENYIALGFTCIGTGSSTRPQCVICAKVLSHNLMKPSLLRRHLDIPYELCLCLKNLIAKGYFTLDVLNNSIK